MSGHEWPDWKDERYQRWMEDTDLLAVSVLGLVVMALIGWLASSF